MEIINTICNVVLTVCAVLALFKFVFKFEYVFKKPVLKDLPAHKCIWRINESRRSLDKLSERVLDSLENLKYDNADLYFTKDSDTELFRSLSGSEGCFKIKGTNIEEREEKYFDFYNNLTKRGQKELENLEIKIFKNSGILK